MFVLSIFCFSVFFFLLSCGLLEHFQNFIDIYQFFEFIFELISLYCYFNGSSVCCIIYTCNLSQFTCLDILLVCMKYKNLTSLYTITLLNISFMYTENQIRECYNFCFNHKPQFRKLNRRKKIYCIYHIFTLSIVLPL